MRADSRIHNIWLRLLGEPGGAGKVSMEKVEDGYYAVVLATDGNVSSASLPERADYQALESLIPNLNRTRAVYLNSGGAYHLSGIESLRDWAGELAQKVEAGTRHAFAVVDTDLVTKRVSMELRAAGWEVERTEQDLKVSDGRFAQQVNALRAIVQMVLSRSSMAEAAGAVRKEIGNQFALDAELFRRFQRRFEKFEPTVIDRYFGAHPEASCVAPAWDYWEVSGKARFKVEQIFEQAMEDFEAFLVAPLEEWLPGFPVGAWERNTLEN